MNKRLFLLAAVVSFSSSVKAKVAENECSFSGNINCVGQKFTGNVLSSGSTSLQECSVAGEFTSSGVGSFSDVKFDKKVQLSGQNSLEQAVCKLAVSSSGSSSLDSSEFFDDVVTSGSLSAKNCKFEKSLTSSGGLELNDCVIKNDLTISGDKAVINDAKVKNIYVKKNNNNCCNNCNSWSIDFGFFSYKSNNSANNSTKDKETKIYLKRSTVQKIIAEEGAVVKIFAQDCQKNFEYEGAVTVA